MRSELRAVRTPNKIGANCAKRFPTKTRLMEDFVEEDSAPKSAPEFNLGFILPPALGPPFRGGGAVIDLPIQIQSLLSKRALFVLNDSGGKDSQAMRIALGRVVPASQKIVMHASLGDVEWPGALEHAQAGAARHGLPFVVARANKSLLDMVERRFKSRPKVPSWPSASHRQCTSDLKRDPISREIRRIASENGINQIVNCMGIRAEESAKRSKLQPVKRNERNSRAGRDWWDWFPIFDWTREQVFEQIAVAGEVPHPAYALGNDRLSCMFCIMGSRNDLRIAAHHNPALFARYVALEERTGYTMHQSRLPLRVLCAVEPQTERPEIS